MRTVADALAHAERIKQGGHDHCLMCEAPRDEGARLHAERYQAQYQAEVHLVLLADEISRLREEMFATVSEALRAAHN